jgi:SAM-dependent methyltransferase
VFNNPQASHEHSLSVLKMIYQYDSFLDSIQTIADMGCGSGLDAQWWAQLTTRDDPPIPHNYRVYAVDRDTSKIEPELLRNSPNIKLVTGDYDSVHLNFKVDLMWSHDSFQYSLNPLQTLNHWNRSMNKDGMLMLNVPMHTSYHYNRLQTRSYSGSYYTYNVCNLMYMLAVSGFDCRDCYIDMNQNNEWIHFAVYKSHDPFDPATTSWFDLADKGVIIDSAMESLNTYGYVRQEDLIFTWLDKDWRFARN